MNKTLYRERHYAVSCEGVLVHITDAQKTKEDYFCPHCGCRMMKRCGKIRAWHFAHDWRYDNDSQNSCTYETYLHKYAKLRLKQWFDNSKCILLHYLQTIVCKKFDECNIYKGDFKHDMCSKSVNKTCNLKQSFNQCTIETSIKGSNGIYRADLLLSSSDDPSRNIALEIKVSHGCTEKKKTSNIQIIEFNISSEEDVDHIITHDIECSNNVKFYGFKNLEVCDKKGEIKPVVELTKFYLYKSGKTIYKLINCQQITHRCPSSLFEITTRIPKEQYRPINLIGLKLAYEHGFVFPNCCLCKHLSYNKIKNASECELNKQFSGRGSDALECESYDFDPNKFEITNCFKFDLIDIWSRELKN